MKEFPPLKPIKETDVLVVDSQTLVHDIIQKSFKEIGVDRVVCTQNSYRALRECENTKFDIFVLAFNASHDKDGFHLLEELKLYNYITERTTVIFLSAETSPQLVNCIIEMQPHDFWVKPLNPHRVVLRLKHLIASRKALHKLNSSLDENDFAGAIYQAERLLKDERFKEFHNKLRRIKGDCLLRLFAFEDAQTYFEQLQKEYEAGWVRIGLVKALLKQEKFKQAEPMIKVLLEKDDTRFPMYDLLAQHNIEKSDYQSAYEQMQQACNLAPRNMDRNRKLWDLARLNHDRRGQLRAVHAMAKYAKNSVHDSPILTVNVMRAHIDLAASLTGEESERLTKKAQIMLDNLKQEHGDNQELKDIFIITEARLASLRNDKKWAEELVEQNEISQNVGNIEDGLDKMKVFHELGMREQCLAILEKLKSHIQGDDFSNEVVNAYIEQESIERKEVNFSTKELKQMAATHYQNGRFEPAMDSLKQARILSPTDVTVVLSMLKVAVQLKKNDLYGETEQTLVSKAQDDLKSVNLAASQKEKLDNYLSELA